MSTDPGKAAWPMLLVRAAAVWLILIGAEVVHGAIRVLLVEPYVGDLRSRQIGVLTGSFLVLGIAYLCVALDPGRIDPVADIRRGGVAPPHAPLRGRVRTFHPRAAVGATRVGLRSPRGRPAPLRVAGHDPRPPGHGEAQGPLLARR